MKVTKYRGANMREVLAQAKRELGEHAIILSTRELRRGVVGAGVEITAVTEVDEAHAEGPSPAGSAASGTPPGFSRTLSNQAVGRPPAEGTPPGFSQTLPNQAVGRPPAGGTQPPALAEADVERIMGPLRSELRALRSLLRASPADGNLRQELTSLKRAVTELAAGTGAQVVIGAAAPPLDEVARGARLTMPSEARVVALVGPTGAGKTTTIAKLGARAALVRGLRVGFITLDDYRVGGEEQLRIFADLIPAPLHVAQSRMELARALHLMADCDLIYIDTSGRSPRDRQALTELAGTLSAASALEIHLVIPAPSAPSYIDGLTGRYQSALSVDRLLFTKLDEADDLSELVRAPARLGLPVAHVTMGQAVPEDLDDVDDAGLYARAAAHERVGPVA